GGGAGGGGAGRAAGGLDNHAPSFKAALASPPLRSHPRVTVDPPAAGTRPDRSEDHLRCVPGSHTAMKIRDSSCRSIAPSRLPTSAPRQTGELCRRASSTFQLADV